MFVVEYKLLKISNRLFDSKFQVQQRACKPFIWQQVPSATARVQILTAQATYL